MNLAAIQVELQKQKLDGWLFFDHHRRDPLAYRVLGFQPASHVTRRWYYWIPAAGEPRGLVHRIESGRLDSLPGDKIRYSDRKSTRLNSSHLGMSYAVFCLEKTKGQERMNRYILRCSRDLMHHTHGGRA